MSDLYLRVDKAAQQFALMEPGPEPLNKLLSMLKYRDIELQIRNWQANEVFALGGKYFRVKTLALSDTVDLLVLTPRDQGGPDPAQLVAATLEAFTLASKVFDHCKSTNEMCFQAVKFAKDMLKFDRAAVLLLSKDEKHVLGTWGTNAKGEIVEEADMKLPLSDFPWLETALKQPGQLIVEDNVTLKEYDRAVGSGWNGVVSIFYNESPLGWFCCDNLLSGREIDNSLKSQIAHFGTVIGQWLIRKENEEALKRFNETLEREISNQTAKLQETIEELSQAQTDLVSNERAKALSTFTAGIAHEINNPIGFIRGNLSFIGKISDKVIAQIEALEGDELAKSKKFLKEIDQVIDESVEGLDRVSNIISMLQPLNKLAEEDPQDFDLKQAIEFAAMGIDAGDVEVTVDCQLTHVHVMLPLQMFTLALENVMENAIDAAKRSSEDQGRIVIKLEEKNNKLWITIADNGNGIPEDQMNTIFSPFFTTKPPGEGLGLGLSLSENLIQLANGRMHVISKENQGTAMSIIFNSEVIQRV